MTKTLDLSKLEFLSGDVKKRTATAKQAVSLDRASSKLIRSTKRKHYEELKKEGNDAAAVAGARADALVDAYNRKVLKSATLKKEAQAILKSRAPKKEKENGSKTAEA